MKILVVSGSRTITDAGTVFRILNEYKNKGFTHVMQGTAKGVDSLAKLWTMNVGLVPMDRPADWNRYGKRAGPLRNEAMADESHKVSTECELIAIWDGRSNGTYSMYHYWKNTYPTSPARIETILKQTLPDWGKRNI